MDDLISRQAAIDALLNHYEVGNTTQNATMDDCVMILRNLPSAQKTGTWIDHQEGKWIYAQCNICGTTWDAKSNYCPNCGARMERE